MPKDNVTISEEDFISLPAKHQRLVIFKGLEKTNLFMTDHVCESDIRLAKIEKKQDRNSTIGFIWAFLLTVAFGLKKYLPFL